jgi:hypothetical protein
MKAHISYLKYLLHHKWFVFLACRKLEVSLWRAVVHDWHKFLPSEWFAYVNTFYDKNGNKRYFETPAFSKAWNYHQKRGKHHWQYWVLIWDRGDLLPLEMPHRFVREMVADWMGAGRAITGKWEALEWYEKNKEKIKLHPHTRNLAETLLRNAMKSSL